MKTWLIANALAVAALGVVFVVVRFVAPLKRPSAAQLELWEKLQSQGRIKFALKSGLLLWGGFMFVVMTATDATLSNAIS